MGNAGSVYYDTRSELMWFRMDGQALTTNIECRHNLSNRNYMSASHHANTSQADGNGQGDHSMVESASSPE
jgi:hypothetical protein